MEDGAVSTAGREVGSPCGNDTTEASPRHLEDSVTSSTSFHTAHSESLVCEGDTPTAVECAETPPTCDATTHSVSDSERKTITVECTETPPTCDATTHSVSDSENKTPTTVECAETPLATTHSVLDGENKTCVVTSATEHTTYSDDINTQAEEGCDSAVPLTDSTLRSEAEVDSGAPLTDSTLRSEAEVDSGATEHTTYSSDTDTQAKEAVDSAVPLTESTLRSEATEKEVQWSSSAITTHITTTNSTPEPSERESRVARDFSNPHQRLGTISCEETCGHPDTTQDIASNSDTTEDREQATEDAEKAVEDSVQDSEEVVGVKKEQVLEVKKESVQTVEAKGHSEPTNEVNNKDEEDQAMEVEEDRELAMKVKGHSKEAIEGAGNPLRDVDMEISDQYAEGLLEQNVPPSSNSNSTSQNDEQTNELSASTSPSSSIPPQPKLLSTVDTDVSETSKKKTDNLSESPKKGSECTAPPLPSLPVLSEAVSAGQKGCEVLSLSSSVLREVGEGEGEGEGGRHTPSVSSSGYGGSRESSPEDGDMITEDMKAEEERLRERESRDGSFEREAGELSHMKEYQRYMRLQHLLQKSSIYSKFLLDQMENQVQEKKKNAGKGRRKMVRGGAAAEKKREEKTKASLPRRSTRSRKRKADKSLELSHFMDEKGKLKQLKLDNGVPVDAAANTKKVPAEEKQEEKERSIDGKVVPVAQPGLMTGGVMRPYQVEGMEWIKVLYENGVNGILADEMGLGKTLQVIGVIAHLIEMGVQGPFLVAAPLSTLPNWVSEFKKFTPEIPVILYHGTQMEREKLRRKMFKTKMKKEELDTLPVAVTSYEICMRDQRHLMSRNWKFLVVDEGHRIKNLNCKLIRALKSYDAANRLLLTGTPLQNNLSELWSLLNFILPDIFDDLNGFQSWFDFDVNSDDNREKIIAQEREQNVLSKLHQILTPFLLRRLKTDVELSLPPKKEVLVYAPLTSVQQRYYTSLLDKTIFEMVKGKGKSASMLSAGENEGEGEAGRHRKRASQNRYAQLDDDQFESLLSGEKSYEELVTPPDGSTEHTQPVARESATNIKLTNVWMMLRKCCNHPYLLEFPMTPDGQFRVDEDLVTCCGKLMLLDRLLPALISRGHKTIVFSQFTTMLDILEDYLELRRVGYGRLDGAMPFGERQRQMAVFQGDPDCKVFLTSTRAGGLGINLTAADTVIIYDSDWNPQADLQAQDRCHRIGQTKPVMVYRLVTANTFDQRVVERAASKRRLEKMVIHKGKFKGYSREDQQLSLEDLTSLLHSVDHESIVDSHDAIISDKALEALLDRSPGAMKEGEGKGASEHGGIFKVIAEQDSSELSINTCNASDTSDQSTTVPVFHHQQKQEQQQT